MNFSMLFFERIIIIVFKMTKKFHVKEKQKYLDQN